MSILLLFYFACTLLAASPPSSLTDSATRFITTNLNYFGLFESYGVYAPDPAKYNQRFKAVIEFQDGSRKTWMFPDLSAFKGSDFEGQLKEKWVELNYYLCWDSKGEHLLIPDLARYVARLFEDRSNEPVSVTIEREYSAIAPPGEDPSLVAQENVTNQMSWQYIVRAEDLK